MRIRQEEESDFPDIYKLVKSAFATAKEADGDEQDFVNRLRSSDHYIPELALVAEQDGLLMAHIMLTRLLVSNETGAHPVLLLAPLAVLLEFRNQSVGSQLVREAFVRARKLDYPAVIVFGDPGYYSRFGFRPSTDFGIKNANGFEDKFVMACELVPGGLENMSGRFLLPG